MRNYLSASLLVLILFCVSGRSQTSTVKNDETMVFFPAIGRQIENGKAWELEIHGCVYEPDRRTALLTAFHEALRLDRVKMDRAEWATFKDRARLFLVDNKGGIKISVRIGDKIYSVGKSKSNGHFEGKVRVASLELERLHSPPGRIDFLTTTKDFRIFTGVVELVDDTGLTVISDIDDTIKVTQVLDRSECLRRTFLDPFQAVPGMAEAYQKWAKMPGTRFHYVSASPWQLYTPLAEFARVNHFPAGTFHLKHFRWKDESFFSIFASPETYKLQVIEPMLKQFPNRRFVLVGDSGERDPEAYAILARKYPRQVAGIFIRNVTNQGTEAERFRKDFEGLPAGLWKLFNEPAEISLPAL